MESFYVRRVLIDQWNSCDILHISLFYSHIISKKDLLPNNGWNLHGFKRISTRSWRYLELLRLASERSSKPSSWWSTFLLCIIVLLDVPPEQNFVSSRQLCISKYVTIALRLWWVRLTRT